MKRLHCNTVRRLVPVFLCATAALQAQMIDQTTAPNTSGEGIAKSLAQQIGAGRGDLNTPDSSMFIIRRDPFRSIRRGRQVFQRKFTRREGLGPRAGDGAGSIHVNLAIGAGLADSCAACHSRPRGSAGFGGSVATRPDSRDAPHLFGLGLKEMLADEITADLRQIRAAAIAAARGGSSAPPRRALISKGVSYGFITARRDGSVDTSAVTGVDPDLRVRPFFAHGGTISIREFVVGALNAEMGMQAVDPELDAASRGGRMLTPAGMVLDGSLDTLEAPPARTITDDPDGDGATNEIPVSLVDHLEFYFLNYFKPALHEQNPRTADGRELLTRIGCTSCHVPHLPIRYDRRVADVETAYDAAQGAFNRLFATATPLFQAVDDGRRHPPAKAPRLGTFMVRNIFTDFKRHDLGPAFYERSYDGTVRREFLTAPLWGVGSSAPFGHDGRSINLTEVILRHGGEAQTARDNFARLPPEQRERIEAFLNSLVLFPPDDTASNLGPADRNAADYPQWGHGSIKLSVLFNNPSDPE